MLKLSLVNTFRLDSEILAKPFMKQGQKSVKIEDFFPGQLFTKPRTVLGLD